MRDIRFGVLCTGIAVLGGCGLVHAPVRNATDFAAQDTQVLRLSSSQSLITAPQGYCFDEASLNEQGSTGFVLMGPCANSSDTMTVGLFSIALAPTEEPIELATLEALLTSQNGRGFLARSGQVQDIEILYSGIEGDVLLLNARDTSEQKISELSEEYWRAIVSVKGQLLSVTGATVAAESSLSSAPRLVSLQVAKTFLEHN